MGDRDRAVPAVRIAACVPCQRQRRRGVPVLARGGGVERGHAAGEALVVPFAECGDPVALGEAQVMIEQFVHHPAQRSEEHTSELQSLMRTSYAVFCFKTKNRTLLP